MALVVGEPPDLPHSWANLCLPKYLSINLHLLPTTSFGFYHFIEHSGPPPWFAGPAWVSPALPPLLPPRFPHMLHSACWKGCPVPTHHRHHLKPRWLNQGSGFAVVSLQNSSAAVAHRGTVPTPVSTSVSPTRVKSPGKSEVIIHKRETWH